MSFNPLTILPDKMARHTRNTPPRGSRAPKERDHARSTDEYRWVVGRNPVREVVKAAPERVKEILLSPTLTRSNDLNLPQNLKVREVDVEELDEIAGHAQHQGCIARITPKAPLALKDLIEDLTEKDDAIVLALDNIQDPQNFGSILRAAECFGVAAVLYSRNRGSGLTPAASKASAGASELVDLVEVANLVDALEKLKKENFWVVATAIDSEAQKASSFDFPKKTVLVMGSEGAGVQPLVLKRADFKVYIEMFGSVDSLNVSQATAVLLHQLKTRR